MAGGNLEDKGADEDMSREMERNQAIAETLEKVRAVEAEEGHHAPVAGPNSR